MTELQGGISLSILFPTQLFPLLQNSCHIGLQLKSPEPAAHQGRADAICGMECPSNMIATGQAKKGSLPLARCHPRYSLNHRLNFCPITDFPTNLSAYAHTLPTSHSRPGLYHFRSCRAVLSHCGTDVSFNSHLVYRHLH